MVKPQPKLRGGLNKNGVSLADLRPGKQPVAPKPKRLANLRLDPSAHNKEVARLNGAITSPKKELATLKPRPLYALDTETTGLDFHHGCRPFFVSCMDADGNLQHWEWDVNPHTREVGVWTFQKAKGRKQPNRLFVPGIPEADKAALTKLIQENDFVLHNTRFDTRALESVGLPRLCLSRCHDTLLSSHVLVSNEPHGLKDLAIRYLDISDADQQALRDATNEARRIARGLGWAIASDGGHPHFPGQRSAPKDGWWVYDTWLPRAIARYKWEVEGDPDYAPGGSPDSLSESEIATLGPKAGFGSNGHPWWTVLSTYALKDVERTYPLFILQLEGLKEEGLGNVYQERRKLLDSVYTMESNGVTFSVDRLDTLCKQLKTEALAMQSLCLKLAKKACPTLKDLNLNSPKQLTGLLYDDMGIKPVKLTTAGMKQAKAGDARNASHYSTNAESLNIILGRLHESYPKPYLPPKKRQQAYDFIWNLLGFRAREKSLDYLEEYRVRSVSSTVSLSTPTNSPSKRQQPKIPRLGSAGRSANRRYSFRQPRDEFASLYPSFNPTGSDTLRFSSSNPNAQNIGKGNKRKDDPVPSLRSIFGPAPGREWYSIDYSNIELRIFAYASGDEDLIAAYEQGFAVHCIFAELLFEKEFKECRRKCNDDRKAYEKLFKDTYESTLYQWTKNGNFALIYGAGEARADSTYHRPGAYKLIRDRMPLIDEFMSSKNQEAKIHGYITTLGGYRLWVPASEPHVAVNYFVQGSAGWCMVLAINRVHEYLQNLNRSLGLGLLTDGSVPLLQHRGRRATSKPSVDANERPYQMIMTIHDELDFDFPKHERNHKVISDIARIMESSGTDIGIPTPVEVELHAEDWSKGEKVSLLPLLTQGH